MTKVLLVTISPVFHPQDAPPLVPLPECIWPPSRCKAVDLSIVHTKCSDVSARQYTTARDVHVQKAYEDANGHDIHGTSTLRDKSAHDRIGGKS